MLLPNLYRSELSVWCTDAFDHQCDVGET